MRLAGDRTSVKSSLRQKRHSRLWIGQSWSKRRFSAKAVLVKESVLTAYTRMSDVRGLADRMFGQEEGSRTD